MNGPPAWRRPDPRRTLARDLERRARREKGHRAFWRSLGLMGMVGWPIVFLVVGGALLGRFLDARWDTGVRFTLTLLTAGATVGSWIAWRAVGRP